MSGTVVHRWPPQPTYCRSSSQMEQAAGGRSDSACWTPQVTQMWHGIGTASPHCLRSWCHRRSADQMPGGGGGEPTSRMPRFRPSRRSDKASGGPAEPGPKSRPSRSTFPVRAGKVSCGSSPVDDGPLIQKEASMAVQLGDTAPDFTADTTEGEIKFHDWLGDSWAVLFSHPKDFTPVCTTELGYMANIKPEFDRRGVKLIGLSADPVADHKKWASDINETQGAAPNYPVIGDGDLSISKLYGMLPAEAQPGKRTPADNQTVRNVYVIGPDKKIKLILPSPMTTGRNFDEVLRVIDSLQLTANHKVATPVNWTHGDDVIIAGSVSDDEAKEIFGDWESPKPYIRVVPQP